MLPGSMYSKSLCPYTTCCLPAMKTCRALRGTSAMCLAGACSQVFKQPYDPSSAQPLRALSSAGRFVPVCGGTAMWRAVSVACSGCELLQAVGGLLTVV